MNSPVWKNSDAGKTYGIEVIPTQIFYDAGGKEDILAKWKELGVAWRLPEGNSYEPDLK